MDAESLPRACHSSFSSFCDDSFSHRLFLTCDAAGKRLPKNLDNARSRRGKSHAAAYFVVLSVSCTTLVCLRRQATLPASLSGPFPVQTLPDLVTYVRHCKGTLYLRAAVQRRGHAAPSERFGYYYDCGSNMAPKHARKHETHPPRVQKKRRKKKEESSASIQTILVLFELA